jgi:ketosteroid isomerase-like protein
MSQENVEILRRVNAAANAGNWRVVFDLYHSDAEFRDLAHAPDMPETIGGHEGLAQLLKQWTEPFAEFGGEILQYIDVGPWVICDTRWHGTGKTSDVAIELRQTDAYEIRDGKVAVAIFGYPDTDTALKAVRLEE